MNVKNKIQLSIIIPVYFGQNTIGELVDHLMGVLTSHFQYFEVVLINDGSRDNSHEVCIVLTEKYPHHLRYFELARNFGEHSAVMAGLNFSRGDSAVIIDDDFQNPPEEILKLYEKMKVTNADVVFGYYDKKKHSFIRNLGSWFNDIVANLMLGKPKNLYLCSFKLIHRRLIDELVSYRGPFPYIDGLILRSTCHFEKQLVSHSDRKIGKSNYTFRKLISLWSNVFVNFSLIPLRLSLFLGFLSSFFGILCAIYFIIEKIQEPHLPVGWASTIVSILFIGGIQLIVVGVVGEYVGRVYLSNTGTPQFVVRSRYGKEDGA